MNYNKLTSLVANVEAIETAVQIHVQGRTATTDEKEILSLYSGFGGIKEVLNIGTDNPVADNMTESLNRLETALRTLAGEDGTMYKHKGIRADRFLHTAVHCGRSGTADTHHIQGQQPANALLS